MPLPLVTGREWPADAGSRCTLRLGARALPSVTGRECRADAGAGPRTSARGLIYGRTSVPGRTSGVECAAMRASAPMHAAVPPPPSPERTSARTPAPARTSVDPPLHPPGISWPGVCPPTPGRPVGRITHPRRACWGSISRQCLPPRRCMAPSPLPPSPERTSARTSAPARTSVDPPRHPPGISASEPGTRPRQPANPPTRR